MANQGRSASKPSPQGKPLEGIWRDRSLEYEAHRREQEAGSETFTKRHSLRLDPLPCWRHLPSDEIRRRLTEMVAEIDAESARRLVLGGSAPLGAAAIRNQHPHQRLARGKKSPASAAHAASKAVRKQLKEAYRLFVEAYRQAAVRLRSGNYSVEFPQSCVPPPRPCVSSVLEQPGSREDRSGCLDRLRLHEGLCYQERSQTIGLTFSINRGGVS